LRNSGANTHDHAVASHCDHQDHYWFFDPNGGFMDFGAGQDAWFNMQQWLETELKTATANHYDEMQMVTAHKFVPK
jgi:hypothetical protein